MKKLIQLLKTEVETASENPTFIHYEWFLTYHLTIVEKIALETCTSYPKADKNMVLVLVWLHDYGKIMNFDNQYTTTVTTGKKSSRFFSILKVITI
jgi:23S rRNA maturation-related 3'-5' exoribonuclease YhaM